MADPQKVSALPRQSPISFLSKMIASQIIFFLIFSPKLDKSSLDCREKKSQQQKEKKQVFFLDFGRVRCGDLEFAKNRLNKWVPKKEEKKERKSIFVLSPQSRRGQINNLVYQRNDHSTDFFLLFFKKLSNFFFWFLLFDDFFSRKIAFLASRPGVANPRPNKKFLRRNSVIFRYFEFCSIFFSNAAHRPNRVDHPCSRQTPRDFFCFS